MFLQKLKDWQKNLNGVPLLMEESIVKEYLTGAGYDKKAVRKYKTLPAWEHKKGIHSVKLRGDYSHIGALLFMLCDVVAEEKQQLPPDLTCTDLPCSWSDPKEKYFAIADLEKRKDGGTQNNLKRNIHGANQGSPLPPILHIFSSKENYILSETVVHDLPDVMTADDINLVFCHEIQVDFEENERTKQENIRSPIRDHPASLSDILRKAEAIIEKISVDDDRINESEKATKKRSRSSQLHAERFPRITASKCKRALIKETTSPTKAMQDILCYNKAFQSQYMRDGIK
ncbi:hypothetical protein AWC38_SpisGene15847 [Stylophora pistillata]|uniref:Uncharacterized protein n=1 Tax=Stylophora pistillata TaxID=50429 RepID=A0A2B4RTN9_STYPI|nr:hypothetical protein AWC38_SpisGene15847 [Stylophora pistillata]